MNGGTLLYIGDGSDPFHRIDSWWRKSGYENPARHLFRLAGMEETPEDGVYPAGNGKIVVWNMVPAKICLSRELAQEYRYKVKDALESLGPVSYTHLDVYKRQVGYDDESFDKEICRSGSVVKEREG